ncbi:unnamed protein product, partial [marine sediment metagenome]
RPEFALGYYRLLANIYGFDMLNINSTCPSYTLDFQEPFATFD